MQEQPRILRLRCAPLRKTPGPQKRGTGGTLHGILDGTGFFVRSGAPANNAPSLSNT
jgi:hypothetical protein